VERRSQVLEKTSRFRLGLLGILFFGLLFFFLIPWVCVKIDRRLSLSLPVFLIPIGIFIFPFAFVLLMECWRLFFSIGRGTPAPIAPPKNLVTEGPYKYTRNPMVVGLFLALISLNFILRSPSFLIFLLLLLPLGILFIKLYEEKDLERKFGEVYIAYKKETPFLIPRYSYLKNWTKLFIFAFFKGIGKALLCCHLFFTFWRKVDECMKEKDWLDREDLFWIPAWAGFFGQIQRVLFLIVPPMVFVIYAFLFLVMKMPFILIPVFTQLIDIWVERRFLNKKIEEWAKSMEE
jgi:protein-S-isoprenylcysteine O-methyltransferase Ste14